MRSVLVSGASIAGPTLAYWLSRAGWAVQVIERSPSLRRGGQPVDIRGAALDVVGKMGLSSEIEERRIEFRGSNILDSSGGSELIPTSGRSPHQRRRC